MFDSNAAPFARRSSFDAVHPVLEAAFYDRPTARVARELLGAVLECHRDGVVTRGRIVEVEAYLGPHDPACHAAVGVTTRNRQLHGPAGTAYVYRIYGLHWCVNAVTQAAGIGSAVLVRALVPIDGLEAMRRRRHGVADRALTNGPGKLCQALGIDGTFDGVRLDGVRLDGVSSSHDVPPDGARPDGLRRRPEPDEGAPDEAGRALLLVRRGAPVPDRAVVVTPRIGITHAADWPLRFCIADEPHVSRTPRDFARHTVAAARAWLRARALR